MDKPIRVFILSDNRLFRDALTRIFSKKSDMNAIRSRQFGPDAAEDVVNSGAHVLVLDSTEFLCSQGARLVREGAGNPRIRIVMVAMKEDEALFLEAVRQGVYGYVPKDASAIDVLNAIRSVAQGEAVCPPRLCKHLFDFVAQLDSEAFADPEKTPVLTRREEQLIPLIDRGLTNKEIAAQLNLSENSF